MIEHWISASTTGQAAALFAQLSGPGIDTPEEAALIFSGPQFFIALLLRCRLNHITQLAEISSQKS